MLLYFAVLASVNNKHDIVYLVRAENAALARSVAFEKWVSLVPGEVITDVIPLPELQQRAFGGYVNINYTSL